MFPAGGKVQGSARCPHNLLRQNVLYTANQWEMTFAEDESECVIVLYVIDIVYTPGTEEMNTALLQVPSRHPSMRDDCQIKPLQ